MKIKKERKKMPVHLRGVVTSLRLRPDRLSMYKELGGVKYLNAILDGQMALKELNRTYKDQGNGTA